jgi:hypothetical protein
MERSSQAPEIDEPQDEIGERSATDGAGALHGADDPREFRLRHSDEFLEPMSRARSVERFQDPRSNVERVNPDYALDRSNQVNCADCARCYEATWRGQQQEAAGRAYQVGSSGGLEVRGEPPEMTEEWAHEEFKPTTPGELRQALEQGGHGSSAIIGSQFEDGAHAYNAVNYRGEILTVDGQRGEVYPYSDESIHPLLEDYEDVTHETMAWDSSGRRIV